MIRTASLLALALFIAACSSQPAPPPPGFVMGPNGVQMPGVTVGPNGVQMPGVTVGPGGITAPGVTVGPGGITAPGVAVSPTGVVMPTVAPTAPPADALPSLGIPECDGYAQRACACSNQAAQAILCQSARSALTAWQGALSAGADRAMITQSCQSAAGTLASTCP